MPDPPPKYEVETTPGDHRRSPVYALRGARYVFLRTRKAPQP